jgi:hypothetical protein
MREYGVYLITFLGTHENFLGDFNAKVGKEGILKP